MMNLRKLLAMTLTLCLLAALTACGTSDAGGGEAASAESRGIKVGFSQMDHLGPWRVTQTEDMVNVAAQRGFELVYTDAQEQTSKQLSDIEDLIAQDVDYLIIAPRESTGLERGLEAAKTAGIPVILIDRDHEGVPGEDYVTFIASDFVYQGYSCGVALAEALGGEGNVVVIEGQPGGSDARDRQQGFEDAIAEYPGVTILAQQPGDYSRSRAQSVMENFLQAYGDEIDAVYSHDDEMALGAITAIEAARMAPGADIKIAGIDGQAVAIQAILDGKMTCVVTCSPYFGDTVFDVIEQLVNGGSVESHIQLADYVIDASNAEEELPKGF